MNYPSVTQYTETIKLAVKVPDDYFDKLSFLRPVLYANGEPIMSSGNFAVVFKMKDEQSGKFYAMKCFTKEQEGRAEAYREITKELKDVSSPYLVSIQYLERDLFVDTDQTAETEFPVLLMDWVEGKTLDNYLRENLDDKYALEMLAYQFSQLAQWLIPQPFAHGDLKPDNILVREDGSLVLCDYDGMYVPAMKGQKARELGSPDFRHPLRTENFFDEHIDDFPLLSILFSLKAIANNPQLLNEYGAADRLLLSRDDYLTIHKSSLLKMLFPSKDKELNVVIGLLLIADKEGFLYSDTKYCFELEIPDEYSGATDEELNDAINDKYLVKYSKDKRRLLQGSNVNCYSVTNGTITIVNWTYYLKGRETEVIILPNTIKIIGFGAFSNCYALKTINLPDSIKRIGACAFMDCYSLQNIVIPKSVKRIEASTFRGCKFLSSLIISESVSFIGQKAFLGCSSLKEIIIPQNVSYIGRWAFMGCKSLNKVILTTNIDYIDNAFAGCSPDIQFYVPKGTKQKYKQLLYIDEEDDSCIIEM